MHQWTIYIVGNESGQEYEVTFMRAWRRKTVQKRFDCLETDHKTDALTHYEIRKVERK